jgi:hypothetical protein
VDLNDFTKNNVCISGVNGDFGPLASYNPSALRASVLIIPPRAKIASFTPLTQKYQFYLLAFFNYNFWVVQKMVTKHAACEEQIEHFSYSTQAKNLLH